MSSHSDLLSWYEFQDHFLAIIIFQINWVEYLNHLLKVSNIQITDREKVVLFAPEFMKQLSDLINDMTKTDEGKKWVRD